VAHGITLEASKLQKICLEAERERSKEFTYFDPWGSIGRVAPVLLLARLAA